MSCYENRPQNFGLRAVNPLFYAALKKFFTLDLDVIPVDLASALGKRRAANAAPIPPSEFKREFVVTLTDIKNLAGPDADVFPKYLEWPASAKSTQWKQYRGRRPDIPLIDLSLEPETSESKEEFGAAGEIMTPIAKLAEKDLRSSPFVGQDLRVIRALQLPKQFTQTRTPALRTTALTPASTLKTTPAPLVATQQITPAIPGPSRAPSTIPLSTPTMIRAPLPYTIIPDLPDISRPSARPTLAPRVQPRLSTGFPGPAPIYTPVDYTQPIPQPYSSFRPRRQAPPRQAYFGSTRS